MKRLLMLVALTVCCAFAYAQNNLEFNVEDYPNGSYYYTVCLEYNYQQAIFYAQDSCEQLYWLVYQPNGSMNSYQDVNPLVIDISNYSDENTVKIDYHGCNMSTTLNLFFHESHVPESSTQVVWMHYGEPITLELQPCDGCLYEWSTGEQNTWSIEVSQDGNYTCIVSDEYSCGEPATMNFIVQDNVEIDLATCDLETNLNLVTWPVTATQAQYIDHVIVKRDGLQVGTANYSDGLFTDNIGSGAASRTYTLIAVATNGTECPIVSYPKETIHMSYTLGMNSTIEIGWNTPTGYDLLGYNICEWHEDDGSLTVIDFVGASVTSYTCSQSQFDQGYIVVQGVENGKTESRLLSNRSIETVGIEENQNQPFKVYPNPANGIMFVETVCTPSLPVETYRIVNPIGQTVMEGQITMEKQQIGVRNLPQGMYFITVGGATRKFVVE